MNTPDNLRYLASHEWIASDGTVGITDFAQDQLGDVVFVELPEVGDEVSAGDQVAVVESVKTASDIFAPVDGVIVAVNEDLEDSPELLNDDPYTAGWMFKIEPTNADDMNGLLDAAGYNAVAEEE